MNKTDFLAEIRAVREELRAILARHEQHTLGTAHLPGSDWTAKDVLAHLVGYDQAILAAIADIRAGRPWAWGWVSPNFDDWNERNVGPRRDRTFAAVLAELEASRTDLLRELDRWPEDAGPFGADAWDHQKSEISWLGPHEREHAKLIAKLPVAS